MNREILPIGKIKLPISGSRVMNERLYRETRHAKRDEDLPEILQQVPHQTHHALSETLEAISHTNECLAKRCSKVGDCIRDRCLERSADLVKGLLCFIRYCACLTEHVYKYLQRSSGNLGADFPALHDFFLCDQCARY